MLLLEKEPSEVLKNYTKYPQFNISLNVINKDLINDRGIQELIKTIESDITVSRILVRPSGTESKIRIMIEAPEISIAEKFAIDIANLIKSKQ